MTWIAYICLKVPINVTVQHCQVVCWYRKLLVFFEAYLLNVLYSPAVFVLHHFLVCSEVHFPTVLHFPIVFELFSANHLLLHLIS